MANIPDGTTVVRHQHFFAIPGQDVLGRYDAVELSDGSFWLYGAASDQYIIRCLDWDVACDAARAMIVDPFDPTVW